MAKEDRLIKAVKQMADLPDKNKVNIKGKLYAEVHTRVQSFRMAFGEHGRIMTTLHEHGDKKVMTESTIQILMDGNWQTIANDFAEEYRGVGLVNKTSAVENCITSSIGRALSACGLSGGNYASFEEVDHAMNDKAESKPNKKKEEDSDTADVEIDVPDLPPSDESTEPKEKVADEKFIEIVRVFMEDVETVKGLNDFWSENKDEFKELKETNSKTYEKLLRQFAELKSKIIKKEEKTDG
tara:strand:+ start:6082 stop:6801 length:720 start_codon:yes stop_codon:yes gene_type:complete